MGMFSTLSKWLVLGGQALALSGAFLGQAAQAQDLSNLRLNQVTLLGSHNTYEKKSEFEYLFYALNHVQVIELDVYAGFGKWYVSHSNPIGNNNNCPKNGNIGATRNQDLRSCIDGLRQWHDRNPNHELVIVKMEFKNGMGNSPESLDNLISDLQNNGAGARLHENLLFKPVDFRCAGWPSNCWGWYPTPEAAAQAGAWPTLAQLRGKFMFMIVPGTINANAPKVYADAIRNGSARLAWPVVFATRDADPRDDYYGANSPNKAWTVIMDMQAGRLNSGEVPSTRTAWMAQNNFLIAVSESQPGGSSGNAALGAQRMQQLARDHRANIINTDQEKIGLPMRFARP